MSEEKTVLSKSKTDLLEGKMTVGSIHTARALKHFTLFILCALSAVFNFTASATSLQDLHQTDRVRLKSWIEPHENIIARQQIKLQIEIATDKWFSGGSRIGNVEIKDAILLQREKFGLNSSRNEDGVSWTVQQWTLVIYPQRDGLFEIPAIPVHLSIAGDNLEPVVGELQTEPFSFTANFPEPLFEEMLEKTGWIATGRFSVDERFDQSFDDLNPGDAIVRTISMSAFDLPAMMLPSIIPDNFQGIAVYTKPPQLTDKVNRGTYLAEKSQVITYVFEKPGDYELPKQSFYWWNTETETFETIELDARVMKVHEIVDLADNGTSVPTIDWQQTLTSLIPTFAKIGFTLLSVVFGWLAFGRLRKKMSGTRSNQPEQISERKLRNQFGTACRANNTEVALRLFYQWLDNYGGTSFRGSVSAKLSEIKRAELSDAFRKIMQTLYTPDKNADIDLMMFANQFINELEKLDRPAGSNRFSIDLKLN